MLTNLKIGVRLALAFGIVLALLATLSIIALARTSGMRNDMNAVTGGIAVESSLADQMRLAATQQAVRVRNILMVSEPEEMAAEPPRMTTRLSVRERVRPLDRYFVAWAWPWPSSGSLPSSTPLPSASKPLSLGSTCTRSNLLM